jgi:hypothetical protein
MESFTYETLKHEALSPGDGILQPLRSPDRLPPALVCAPGLRDESGESAATGETIQKRRSLLHNVRMVAIGLALGLTSHVIYLFVLSMLPYEQSGGARLSDRLITLLSGG